MIYLDPLGHLAADSPEELHAFAARLGLARSWFQEKGAMSHYDLMTARMRERAVALGARPVTVRAMPGIVRRMNAAAPGAVVGAATGATAARGEGRR